MYGIHQGLRLEGKSVLVTGGASGMGRSTALMLADVGADVMIGDINEAGMAETIKLARDMPGRIMARRTDVGVEGDLIALVDTTVQTFGRLDGAANIAGYAPRAGADLMHEITHETWQRMIDINLAGIFFGMKYQVIQMMKQGDAGAIVNISSTAALRGFPGVSDYSAAKSGMIGLSRAVSQEYGRHKIRINVVCPGSTDTPILRDRLNVAPQIEKSLLASSLFGRLAHPDEVAYAVRWLLSAEASYVTGACLAVDGGQTA
jgi:NAD(P)-dependent dehydrogenase (short-subunit alcohol dehydrogenase family)